MTRTSRDVTALGALRAGYRAAGARPGLVAAIWACQLVIGLALAVPIFRWLYATTAYRPAADGLAERFSFGLFAELQQADGGSLVGLVQNAFAGGLVLAAVTAPLLVAAALASLRDDTLGARDVGSAATSLYWPFLRVLVLGRALAIACALGAAMALRPALKWLSEGPWEPGWLWAAGIRAGAALLVGVLLLAAVDYALVRLERDRSRRGFRAWLAGLKLAAVSRVGLTLALWAGAGLMLGVLVAAYAGLDALASRARSSLPAAVAIIATIVLQQAFIVGRTWLRLGLLGAEQQVVERTTRAAAQAELPPVPPDDRPSPADVPPNVVAGEGATSAVP